MVDIIKIALGVGLGIILAWFGVMLIKLWDKI